MRRVRRDVMQETAGQQVPWSTSSLTGSFVFQPRARQTPVPVAVPPVVATPEGAAAAPEVEERAEPSPEKQSAAETASPLPKVEPNTVVIVPELATKPDADDEVVLSSVDPAQQAPGTAPTDTSAPARLAPLSKEELARRTQVALNRLGCNAGIEDGIWGNNSRGALERLAKHAPSVEIAALDPTEPLLRQMEALDGRICPLECAVTENLIDGACVEKTCPSGQRLSSKGQCYTPQAASSRQRTKRSGSNCFSFNGQTFCE